MTTVEEYLSQVRRAMTGMDVPTLEDILRELRSHLEESTAANGGNVGAALAQLGPPAQVGRGYRDLYGYDRTYRILFIAVAFLLAIPTVPVLRATEESLSPYSLSVPLLVALTAWVLWVSVRAGSQVGLYAGVAAFAARIAALGTAAVAQPGAEAVPGGLALFLAVSILLIALGWLPGTAKKSWTGPRAEL